MNELMSIVYSCNVTFQHFSFRIDEMFQLQSISIVRTTIELTFRLRKIGIRSINICIKVTRKQL